MENIKDCFLIILDGTGQIREINLNSFGKEQLSFGRSAENDIVIPSDVVSRNEHGFFVRLDGKMYVCDNGSTNGIIINNQQFGTDRNGESVLFPLCDGDIIRIDRNAERDIGSGIIMFYSENNSGGRWKGYECDGRGAITIGRMKDCNIVLPNMMVSRHHAVIRVEGGRAYIEDLNTPNGIFVNGTRVSGRAWLNPRDVIFIANSLLFYSGNAVFYKASIGGTRVDMRNITRIVKGNIKILDNVNITVEPNEFVAIVGGSGAGKSTVMNAMSGFEQATSGSVLVNSMNLYKNYKVLKNIIGYVPQQDIIYENITLRKMLEYSARMRMPDDVSDAEIRKRIDEVLNIVELHEHSKKFIRSLSGGQKKRASIAVELLADPGLFFLDEPTSGLDPGTEESLMKTLRGLSRDKGKTIIMVTHTTQNLHLCDKILFMGKGGRVCFYGSPAECISFFGVKSLTEIYNMLLTDKEVKYWSEKYYSEKHRAGQSASSGAVGEKIKTKNRASFLRQFFILTSRYLTLIKNDMTRLMMIFLQPIIIGILLVLVAADDVYEIFDSTQSIMFALSCAGIWVGLFNSIQEICKERNILKREYMANLKLGAYTLSKFVVQFMMAVIQAVILVLIFIMAVGSPEEGLFVESAPAIEMMITMILTIFSGSAIGLMISALSKTNDKAMTVAPFVLIIQLLFSGILFELSGITEKISYLTISKWSVEALGITSNFNDLPLTGGIPHEANDAFEYVLSNMTGNWLVLGLFAVVCFAGILFILRGVSKDQR